MSEERSEQLRAIGLRKTFTLHNQGGEYEMSIATPTEGSSAVELGKFLPTTGLVTLDNGFGNTAACSRCRRQPDGPTTKQHRALNDLVATLDEKSRRLVVGLLAKQHGRGGITRFARITGLSRDSIRRGQRELAHPDQRAVGRIRRPDRTGTDAGGRGLRRRQEYP